MSWLLLLRWSARDLRRKWVQVTAIALVIAIGTGLFSALGSTSVWRRTSNDDSFRLTGMYDVRVRASEGAYADEGSLLAVLDDLADPSVVVTAEERLVVTTQVDASTADRAILVPGRVIGLNTADGGPRLTIPFVADGDGTALGATSGDTVVLERNFADYYDLRPGATVRLAGGQAVDVAGLGLAPEYFLVTTEEGGFFAQANFAAVFMPLGLAQSVSGHDGQVNDLVLRVRDGADVDAVVAELEGLFADSPLGATVMTRGDDDSYRLLYDDIDGDQKVNDVFALLVLLGAVFGAFNLSSRMIEAQRREIGIAMALGASRRQLAIRPLLVGAEIALLGAALGVGVGLLAIEAMRPVYLDSLPMPVWHMGFQWTMFARGAALGFALPLVATALPVLRAIRTTPVEAITTTHRDPRRGLSRLVRGLRWPRSAFRRMPIGNVLRTPRRTLLTSLGIAAAIATLVGVLGMLDSFYATIDANDREVLRPHGDRLLVAFDTPISVDSDQFTALAAQPAVGSVKPVLRVGGQLGPVDGKAGFDVLIETLDMRNTMWAPTAAQHSTAASSSPASPRKTSRSAPATWSC